MRRPANHKERRQTDCLMKSRIPLHDYQEVAKNFLLKTEKGGLFLDVGFGKTLVTLSTLEDLGMAGQIEGHILTIAPKAIARSTWIDEMDKWGIQANIESFIVDYDPERYEREMAKWNAKMELIKKVQAIYPDPCDLKKNKGVVIDGVKYPPSKFLMPKATETCAFYKNPPKMPPKDRPLTKEQRLQKYADIENHAPSFYFINRELICDLIEWLIANKKPWPFQTVVIDELQSFKSYNSQRFKAMKLVMPFVKRFIGLTGTPIPNGLEDLWPEIYLMDGGKRLGKNITAYRNKFFYPGLTIDRNVVRWDIQPGAADVIYDLIGDIVISIKNPNLKLPPVTYNNITVYMDSDEMEVYKTLAKENVIDLMADEGVATVEAVNPAILKAKLKQMASGTLYVDYDKDNGQKSSDHKYTVIHRHKLEHLEYIVNNTGSPVLVAYHFVSDQKEIMSYLKASGIDVRVFDGSPDMIDKWNRREIPVMLLHPQSCGHGINIQKGGHTLVWYTVPDSLESYIQVNGRLNRQGQTEPVMIHHLLTSGTVDKGLLKALDNKTAEEQALLDAVAAVM